MPNPLEILAQLGQAKAVGDKIQEEFSPAWVLRTAASAMKRWFLSELAQAVDAAQVATEWECEPAEAKLRLNQLWQHLKERY